MAMCLPAVSDSDTLSPRCGYVPCRMKRIKEVGLVRSPSFVSAYRALRRFWALKDAPRPWVCELCIVLAVVLVSAAFGYVYLDRWGDPPKHAYRFWADASSGVALGKGLGQPDPARVPEIEEFLAKKRDHVDLDKVSADCPVKEDGIGSGRRVYLYLIKTVGWTWAWLGMSWKSLLPLHAVFWGATCGCVYGLFRLGANRLLAAVGTALFVLGPNHLVASALLRDYVKAPFILGCILLMGLLLKKGSSPRIVLWASAGIGALAGIGIGFREDVLICLFPAVLVLVLFLPRQRRRPVLVRVAAVLLMACVFCISAWPILKAMREGSANSAHAIAGGLSSACSSQMRTASSNYQMLPVFNDGFIAASFRAYARSNLKISEPIPYGSALYKKAGFRLLGRYVCYFPADCARRVWASIAVTTLKTPFLYGDPEFRTNAFIGRCAPLLLRLYWPLQGILPYIVVLVLLLIMLRDLRMGLGAILLFLYFTAYPVLQYQYRHSFHLGFLYWWFPAVLIQTAGSSLGRLVSLGRAGFQKGCPVCFRCPQGVARQPIFRVVAILGVLITAVGAYGVAWRVQQYHYVRLLERYDTSKLEPIKTDINSTIHDGCPSVLLQPKDLFPVEFSEEERHTNVRACYLVAEFQGCPAPIPLYCAYDDREWNSNFSDEYRVIPAKTNSERTRFFIPIYEGLDARLGQRPGSHFLGLSIPGGAAPYFVGLYRAELADYELPLFVSVPEDWRTQPTPHLESVARKACGDLLTHMTQYLDVLDNGGFEQWPDNAPAPLTCQWPQAASTIVRESFCVSEGRSAVRQTWSASDSAVSPLERFGVYSGHPQTNTDYGITFEAANDTTAIVAVQLCLVSAPPNLPPALIAVGSPIPVTGPTHGFKTFTGSIHLAEVPSDCFLVAATWMRGAYQPGVSVVWDHFCLAPLPDF